uniref:J domain-containing protein n=1 Tax=Oreochromis aureus TaxID=47969 RepID=A0AAZ1Y2D4_OREAU
MNQTIEKDLYAVLGANPSDSVQQLRHRYQQLALQYHPDRLGGDCSSEAESGVKKFLEVDAAWRVLSDQTTRTQYDLQRRAWTLKQDWPIDSTVYVDDMTWDDAHSPGKREGKKAWHFETQWVTSCNTSQLRLMRQTWSTGGEKALSHGERP